MVKHGMMEGGKGMMVYTMPSNGTSHKSEKYDSISLRKPAKNIKAETSEAYK